MVKFIKKITDIFFPSYLYSSHTSQSLISFLPGLDPQGSYPAESLGCDHQQRLGTRGTMSHYQRCHQGFDDITARERFPGAALLNPIVSLTISASGTTLIYPNPSMGTNDCTTKSGQIFKVLVFFLQNVYI